MADDCKKNQNGNDNQLNISVRKVVKTQVCHVVDRGSIPREREPLELNTSFHKTTDSAFGLHTFRKIKTGQKTERKSRWKRTPNQHFSSLRGKFPILSHWRLGFNSAKKRTFRSKHKPPSNHAVNF